MTQILGDIEVKVELHVLLSYAQFQSTYPEITILYPEESSLMLHDHTIISANCILAVCEPPRCILKLIINFKQWMVSYSIHCVNT